MKKGEKAIYKSKFARDNAFRNFIYNSPEKVITTDYYNSIDIYYNNIESHFDIVERIKRGEKNDFL